MLLRKCAALQNVEALPLAEGHTLGDSPHIPRKRHIGRKAPHYFITIF